MRLKRIRALSAAKVMGVVFALIGLPIGITTTCFSFFGGSPDFGAFGVLVWPAIFGGIGLVLGFVGALLYTIAAWLVGGIDVQFDERKNDKSRSKNDSCEFPEH